MTNAIAERSVQLEEIEVMCSIGLHDFERKAPQRVLVWVEIWLSPAAEPVADSVAETLDYDTVRHSVMEIAGSRHFDLQETLARCILDRLVVLRDVIDVSIRTAKPDVYPDCKLVAYRISTRGSRDGR